MCLVPSWGVETVVVWTRPGPVESVSQSLDKAALSNPSLKGSVTGAGAP